MSTVPAGGTDPAGLCQTEKLARVFLAMCSSAGSMGSAAEAASPSISAAEAAGVSAAEKPRPRHASPRPKPR